MKKLGQRKGFTLRRDPDARNFIYLSSGSAIARQELASTEASEAAVDARRTRSGAASGSLKRRLDVLLSLTQSDLRVRYGRGPWQLVKWLVDPFALVGVYLLLVTFVLDRTGAAPGLSLACAVIPFQLVMMTIVNSLSAINLRSAIVLNMAFDRMLIPISSVMTEAVGFAASFALLALMMVVYGVAPTAAIVWLPIVVIMSLVFAVACAYAASLIGIWFTDARPFVVSFVRAMFFVAPGLVAVEQIPEGASRFIKVNPLSGLFESYRSVLLEGHRPSSWQLLYPLGISLLLLVALIPIYTREQRQFAKVIE